MSAPIMPLATSLASLEITEASASQQRCIFHATSLGFSGQQSMLHATCENQGTAVQSAGIDDSSYSV